MARCDSPEETAAYGERVGASLTPPAVLALCGDLGSGKTHFTKGVVAGLGGNPDAVTSPTFTIVHEYRQARCPVFHFDFYRPAAAGEIIAIGWDDYLDEPAVVVVEWADRFPELFPEGTRWLWFTRPGDGVRQIREGGAP